MQYRIAALPTKFVITSQCDRQLLHTAAAKVVAQNQQVIREFLEDRRTFKEGER